MGHNFGKCPKCDYTTKLELQMKVKRQTKALLLHLNFLLASKMFCWSNIYGL